MADRLKENGADEVVAKFNKRNPVGSTVRYWRGYKGGDPTGYGKTKTTAQVLPSGTAVVWIEGCTGCIALSHVEVVNG